MTEPGVGRRELRIWARSEGDTRAHVTLRPSRPRETSKGPSPVSRQGVETGPVLRLDSRLVFGVVRTNQQKTRYGPWGPPTSLPRREEKGSEWTVSRTEGNARYFHSRWMDRSVHTEGEVS